MPKPTRRPGALPLLAPTESFAGLSIVQELSGETGLQLWLLFRNALLWAESEPRERKEIFSQGAKDRAAAVADPQSAWMAYRVGTLARRRAEYHVAEVWLYHAIETGKRYKQWPAYIVAQISLGLLHAQRGDHAQAREILQRALRATGRPAGKANLRGQRPRLTDMRRRALQDLMAVEMDTGRFHEAERYAREAYELMKDGHPRLPVLAHDVAYLWMQRGGFARALQVFEAVLPHIHRPHERVLICCNLARCAGAEHRADVYDAQVKEIARLATPTHPAALPAGVWSNLAAGAASLGRWHQAVSLATIARTVAEQRLEADQSAQAQAVLGRAEARLSVERVAEPLSPREARETQAFATAMVGSLAMMAAGIQ